MKTASSKIWTQVTMSIFYDNNHYTRSTFTVPFQAYSRDGELIPTQKRVFAGKNLK